MAFDEREVTYGDVTFTFGKMLPMEAKEVFMDHITPMLEGLASADIKEGVGNEVAGLQMIVGLISKAPRDHYRALVRALYPHITYTSPNQQAPQRLSANAENAFKDLDMTHILLVEARAFWVNFRGSWDVLQSEFPSLKLVIQAYLSET